jgi:hypothetical protein
MTKKTAIFIKALQNPIIACVFVISILLTLGWLLPEYWIVVFTAIFTYIISDLLISLIIRGGNGIAIIPTINNKTKHKGHTYIAFFVGIIFSTVFSEFFNDVILALIKNFDIWLLAIIIASVVLGIVVFLDLQAKFYARDE